MPKQTSVAADAAKNVQDNLDFIFIIRYRDRIKTARIACLAYNGGPSLCTSCKEEEFSVNNKEIVFYSTDNAIAIVIQWEVMCRKRWARAHTSHNGSNHSGDKPENAERRWMMWRRRLQKKKYCEKDMRSARYLFSLTPVSSDFFCGGDNAIARDQRKMNEKQKNNNHRRDRRFGFRFFAAQQPHFFQWYDLWTPPHHRALTRFHQPNHFSFGSGSLSWMLNGFSVVFNFCSLFSPHKYLSRWSVVAVSCARLFVTDKLSSWRNDDHWNTPTIFVFRIEKRIIIRLIHVTPNEIEVGTGQSTSHGHSNRYTPAHHCSRCHGWPIDLAVLF